MYRSQGEDTIVMSKQINVLHVLYDDSDIYMLFNSDTRSYKLNIYKTCSINVF